MSNTTINYGHLEDGEPVDAISVSFCDPTSTYGLKRDDTSAIVIAANTALVSLGAGNYSYSFIDPAPSLTYTYFIRVETTGGQILFLERHTESPSTPLVVTGRYASYAGMVAKFGKRPLNRWASVDGAADTDAIEATITAAIAAADHYIDTYLLDGPYVIPFTADPGIPYIIKDVANILAAAFLYEAQGLLDANPDAEPSNRMSGLKANAERDLGRIKSGRVRLLNEDGEAIDVSANTPAAGAFEPIDPDSYWCWLSPSYCWVED
jgi:phage gp36-like protein